MYERIKNLFLNLWKQVSEVLMGLLPSSVNLPLPIDFYEMLSEVVDAYFPSGLPVTDGAGIAAGILELVKGKVL